jgi:DNA/RNA-binding domain of Phe-tRNA-synthetase-like protein
MTTIDGVTVKTEVEGLAAGIVVARGCTVGPAPDALRRRIADAIRDSVEDADVKGAVRDLLRFGKYKPTGRGKPASEYLAKAAREARFPEINNLVDINNLVSLSSQLPISLVDLDLAGSTNLEIRRGREGESFEFNAGGQIIDLRDLLLVAVDDVPRANPVKDSMATKLTDASKDVCAVLYAPSALRERLETATESFRSLVEAFGGGATAAAAIVTA